MRNASKRKIRLAVLYDKYFVLYKIKSMNNKTCDSKKLKTLYCRDIEKNSYDIFNELVLEQDKYYDYNTIQIHPIEDIGLSDSQHSFLLKIKK